MKSKIITLAVAFALGITSIAFSVRPAGVPSGKGDGKNTEIEKPEELAQIIQSLPSADEYYALAMQSAAKKDKGATAVADGVMKMRPVSVYDEYFRASHKYEQYVYKGLANHSLYETTKKSKTLHTQKAAVYFTADAVYYNVDISTYSYEYKSEEYFEDYNGHEHGDTIESETTVKTEVQAEYYLGEKGAFLKYRNYSIQQKQSDYLNGKSVENEKDDKDELTEIAYDAIQNNLGKWINLLYVSDFSLDDAAEDVGNLDLLTEAFCAEFSVSLVNMFKNLVNEDCGTLKKMADKAALAEDKSNKYFDKEESFYAMTPFGRYSLLTEFGYSPSKFTGDDYDSLYPVKNSSFVLDLSDGEKPAWYLSYDFDNSLSSSAGLVNIYSSQSEAANEAMYITNIDNTVAPDVKAKKSLYDFIGKEIKEYFKNEWEGN